MNGADEKRVFLGGIIEDDDEPVVAIQVDFMQQAPV